MTGTGLTSIINLSNQEISTTGLVWGWTGMGSADGIDLTSTAWQKFTIGFQAYKSISESSFGIGFTMKSFNIVFVEKSGLVADIYIDKVEIQTDTAAPVTPPTGAYAPLSHVSNYTNPHQVTKTQVGLSNVPNTDFTTAVGLNTAKTNTSDFVNDGDDTINPFITLNDLPPSTNPLPLNYSVIWTGTGLVFDAAASRYYIVDTYYSATAAQITLDAADATNDRIDLIVADTSGVISKITGTPAPCPAEPNYDLATQFPLKFILVSAGGTVPDGVSNTLVYDENVGSAGGEWDSESTALS